MANWCDFRMMVRGKSENVDIFYKYLTDYDNSPKYFARIFDANIDSEEIKADGVKTMKIYGDCAWSVYSCMCEGSYTYYTDSHASDPKLTCLKEATEELQVEVEIKSEEPGCGFWEHIHYKNGECLCEDTSDLMSEGFDMEDAS